MFGYQRRKLAEKRDRQRLCRGNLRLRPLPQRRAGKLPALRR